MIEPKERMPDDTIPPMYFLPLEVLERLQTFLGSDCECDASVNHQCDWCSLSAALENLEHVPPPPDPGAWGDLEEAKGEPQEVEMPSFGNLPTETVKLGEPQEAPTGETAIRSLLCRAALRGWRRGRRNQDPAQEEIADDLLLEAWAAPRAGGDA